MVRFYNLTTKDLNKTLPQIKHSGSSERQEDDTMTEVERSIPSSMDFSCNNPLFFKQKEIPKRTSCIIIGTIPLYTPALSRRSTDGVSFAGCDDGTVPRMQSSPDSARAAVCVPTPEGIDTLIPSDIPIAAFLFPHCCVLISPHS